MTIRISNGVWFEVEGPLPLENIGWEVVVYDRNNTNTILAVIARYRDLEFEKVISDTGVGSIVVDFDDPVFSAPLPQGVSGDLLAYENIWRVYWNGILRWAFFAEQVEDAEAISDEVRPQRISGRGMGRVLEWATVYPPNWPTVTPKEHTFAAKSLGYVYKTLLDEAQARSTLAFITETFSTTADSEAVGWTDSNEVTISPGGTLLELIQRFADVADFDWQIDPLFTFDVRKTFGLHREGEVRFNVGANVLLTESLKSRREIRNVVLVEGGDGGISVASDAESIASWRRREAYMSAGDANSAATRGAYASAALRQQKDELKSRTLRVAAETVAATVFRDYDIGDIIGIGDKLADGSADYRIAAIAVHVPNDTAEAECDITLQTSIERTIIRLQRLIQAMTRGTLAAPTTVQSSPTIITAAEVASLRLDDLSDVSTAGEADGQYLRLASGVWIPHTLALTELVEGTPTNGQVPAWVTADNAPKWTTPSSGGGGSGGTDPKTIAGIQGSFEAETIALTDGAAIATWADNSAHTPTNDFVQATAGYKPLYKTAIINGYAVVRLDASDDRMTSALNLTAPYTIIFVAKYNGTGGGNNRLICGQSSNWFIGPRQPWGVYAEGWIGGGATGPVAGDFIIGSVVHAVGRADVWWDSIPFGSVAPGGSIGSVALGAANPYGEPANCDLAAVYFWNVALSRLDRKAAEDWLRAKYAL